MLKNIIANCPIKRPNKNDVIEIEGSLFPLKLLKRLDRLTRKKDVSIYILEKELIVTFENGKYCIKGK